MTDKPADCVVFASYKGDILFYEPQNFMPTFEFKKIEGASEYVPFRIEEDCDACYDQESKAMLNFSEWWNVTNDSKTFRCASEADAEWLMNELNYVSVE